MDELKMILAAIALELNVRNTIGLMEIQPRGPRHAAAITKHIDATAARLNALNRIISGKEIVDDD